MRKTTRRLLKVLAIAATAGILASSAPIAFAQRHQIVVIRSVPVIDPFFVYPCSYCYPLDYVSANYGYVKINAHHQRAQLYIDDGYADRIEKAKTFALRPGTHDIELRNSDGHPFFHERVAVIVGKTTKVDVPQAG